MVARRTEAITPPELVERLLGAAGDEVVLVGGQALAFWVRRFQLALPYDVVAVSADTDFLARADDVAAVERFARVLGGQKLLAGRRALTALVGQAVFDISDDEFINVDVLFKIVGLTPDDVRKRAVRASLGSVSFLVMHPLDTLKSRLANLHELVEKQNPKGRMQLALAIDVAREYLRAEAASSAVGEIGGQRSPLQPLVSFIERLALDDDGRKVAKRFGLHVADAIDPALIPAGAFWKKRWPQLRGLMSPDYAARFAPPSR